MRVAAMATNSACGKSNSSSWPMNCNAPFWWTICPPGTSKWNKIEHRLFAFITQNWRGKPLVTHQVIVDLIAATTTQTGLQVHCHLDDRHYPKGRRISDTQLAEVHLEPNAWHGESNYHSPERA